MIPEVVNFPDPYPSLDSATTIFAIVYMSYYTLLFSRILTLPYLSLLSHIVISYVPIVISVKTHCVDKIDGNKYDEHMQVFIWQPGTSTTTAAIIYPSCYDIEQGVRDGGIKPMTKDKFDYDNSETDAYCHGI